MQQQAIIISQKHLSAYDLTTNLIRGGLSKLKLNANARMVLLYLASCYNEKNGIVFPRVKTIAEALDISERGVIRALQELTEKNCIIRSKKGHNTNVYALTQKVLCSKPLEAKRHNDILKRQDDIKRDDTMSLPCEVKQEEIKEQQPVKEEIKEAPAKVVKVAFSSNSLKKPGQPQPLEIPAIIAKNPNIKNPKAYWNSLDENAKQTYISKEKELEELKERKLAEEKEREKRSYENYLKHEALKNSKPFSETCTKEEAEAYIQRMYGANDFMKKIAFKSTTVKQLQAKFNLNLEEILTLNQIKDKID